MEFDFIKASTINSYNQSSYITKYKGLAPSCGGLAGFYYRVSNRILIDLGVGLLNLEYVNLSEKDSDNVSK